MDPIVPSEHDFQAVAQIQTAINNYRSYPPTTLLVERSVQRALEAMEKVMGNEASSLTLADSGSGLLVNGRPLALDETQAPQTKDFLETIGTFGLIGITFKRGIDLQEFALFIQLLSTSAAAFTSQGSLPSETTSRLPNIQLVLKSEKQTEGPNKTEEASELSGVYALVKAGNTEAALDILSEMISTHARERNFEAAEALCKKLYQIDPLALSAIVKAHELIETEKADALDPDHRLTWISLYDVLTTEEANLFFYALDQLTLSEGEPLFHQGDPTRHLYFIDEGTVCLHHESGASGQIPLVTLEAGQMLGEDVFQAVSVCTTSAVPGSASRLRRLDLQTLTGWRATAPSLFRKLELFCASQKNVATEITEKGLDRRQNPRRKINGAATLGFPDNPDGTPGRKFHGYLVDVSVQGVQVIFKAPSEETTGMLLDRRLNISFELILDQVRQQIDAEGVVVAVRALPFEESTLHLRLERPIDGPAGTYLINPSIEKPEDGLNLEMEIESAPPIEPTNL